MSQTLDSLKKQLEKIAAGTHGQLPNVRTFQGRQLLTLQHQQYFHLLPHVLHPANRQSLQVTDLTSTNYGMFYGMVDLDGVDNGSLVA